jgi:hypothetical protein
VNCARVSSSTAASQPAICGGGYGLYLDNCLLVFFWSGFGSAFDICDGCFNGGFFVWVFWCGYFGLFVFVLLVFFVFFLEIFAAPGVFA